ncbi:MAG TPA: C25 family cysteine peptidase [Chitinophagaceae bacterium]
MKRFLLFILLFVSLAASSQPFNNEWIDYSKTYYKFKIAVTGLYRIDQAALPAAINTANAQYFQLWRNGQQIPLYTSRQTGAFQGGDYIEFWGEMNDGKPDNIMYRQTDFQLNDKWSTQTDTAAYFLTINPGINLRLVPTANNVAANVLPAEPYFIYTLGKYWRDRQTAGFGVVVGDNVYSSSYDAGEGWASGDIPKGGANTQVFSNLSVYTGPGAPTDVSFKINASGLNGLNQRRFKVSVNGDSVTGAQMDYFDYAKLSTTFPVSLISGGTATIDVMNLSEVPGSDRMAAAMLEFKYPRQFNFGGATNFGFSLPANANGNYLEISNFNYGSATPVLYDLANGRRYVADITNPALLKFALLPTSQEQKLVLVSEQSSNIAYSTLFQQRNFVNYGTAANQGNYLIITNAILLNGSNGSQPVNDYVNYRSSTAGGSYNAKIYMIDQLVDQFSFGIKFHPLSVRNFIRFARATYSSPVKEVFLIGKGMHYGQFRANESGADIDRLALVPTWGHPASDILLTVEPGPNLLPLTPIGRLSVVSGDEISVYLQKVIEYEQIQAFQSPFIADKAWMKNVGHVVGASDEGLTNNLELSMEKFRKIIVDTFYGGNVHHFSKTSAEAVEVANSVRIQQLFNQGMGLLTYFGHSSASTLEFNLDNPQNYDNVGKYPLFILLGCNAGNYYNYTVPRLISKETISEKFVLAQNRGCIATVASSSLGIVYYLDIYNSYNYKSMASLKYGATLGEAMKEAVAQVYNFTSQNDFYARLHCEQSTLHGDPALRLNTFAKPDYAIEDPMVKISPAFISVAEQNFKVEAIITNIGKAINKKITVEVKRTFPNGNTLIVKKDTINAVLYNDTVSYTIPVEESHKGLNKITITVDADMQVDELYETNNSVTKDIIIYEDEVRPIYPYNHAIVNKQGIKLVGSTANAFATAKQYKMEMDTTKLFNSPMLLSRTVNAPGGIIEFDPGITFTDSTVYYWRVAIVPTTGVPNWNYSSFIYIPPTYSPGFNQSHHFQHLESEMNGLVIAPDRKWAFDSILQNLFIRNTIYPTGGTQQSEFTISVNDDPYIGPGCGSQSIIVNVFNPNSLRAWKNDYTQFLDYGLYESLQWTCTGTRREYNFEYYYYDTTGRRRLMHFLNDIVPDGYYVVLRAAPPASPSVYPDVWRDDTLIYGSNKSLYHLLKDQGFADLDSFNRPRTWIFAYKKNDRAHFTPEWSFSTGIYDRITLSVDIKTPDSIGVLKSPAFGPAKDWKMLYWRANPSMDVTPGDTTTLDVIGVNEAGIETTLISDIPTSQGDIDISSINAATYPYLRLRMTTTDTVHYTPFQLKNWRLTYTPAPEGAIAPNLHLVAKDTLDIGEPLNFEIGFKNISDAAFTDSLKIKVVVTDKNNVANIIPVPKHRKLNPSPDLLQVKATIPTQSFPGKNTMYIEVNPDNDQPEQYHYNNFAFRDFFVRPDTISPLMDVTFDGTHILNRDIVSSRPDILIKLKDEAKWMILNDLSLLTIKVKYPDGNTRTFNTANDTLQFLAAGQAPNNDNTATINLKPFFPLDGDYEMTVTGKDRSNNAAGRVEYKVSFQVINKPMISNMLNYPNPFTTSTAFVFTITGSEVPQNIRIQIMTITGKIVRDITKDELGTLRIGRNITEFKWDGTDQYGQKLANGIYLYRVITNLNGKSLDKYTATGEETDKYFNKGYGKMYLMR